MQGPMSAVFTTVRARNGQLFHLDEHLARLEQHGKILGIVIPEINIPENLEGLIQISISDGKVSFLTKPFIQEAHMLAEGITVTAPRWTRKVMGTKHGDWAPYREITSKTLESGADVALLVHEFCIVDGDRVMPLVLDEDGVVWISEANMGGVDSVTFEVCKPAIEDAGFIIQAGRLNERLVARAKEIVLLGTGMGAARLEILDDTDIGDGTNSLQQVCIGALGEDWR